MNTLKFEGFWDWSGSISWNLVVSHFVVFSFHLIGMYNLLFLPREINSTFEKSTIYIYAYTILICVEQSQSRSIANRRYRMFFNISQIIATVFYFAIILRPWRYVWWLNLAWRGHAFALLGDFTCDFASGRWQKDPLCFKRSTPLE